MKLSLQSFYGGVLALSLVTTFFLGWVVWIMFGTASKVSRAKSKKKSRTEPEEVLCPCVFKRLSVAQFTVGCTTASTASLFLSAMFSTAECVLFFALSPDCHKSDSLPLAVTLMNYYFADIFRSVGYLLMFVSHFERLRLTFAGSMLELPQWTPNVLYATLLVAAAMLAAMQAFQRTNHVVSATLLVVLFLWYLLSVSALIRAFYKRTMAAANDNELVNAAVRITLSVALSLLSTAAAMLLFAAILVFPRTLLWDLLRRAILRADMCLNAFCLLCTLGYGKGYYQRAFGRLHAFCMRRVSILPTIELPPLSPPLSHVNTASPTRELTVEMPTPIACS